MNRRHRVLAAALTALLAFGTAADATPLVGAPSSSVEHGDLTFPADEHAHIDGLDYWWGAADVTTTTGNHYTVSYAYTSFFGNVVAGHQITPYQGAYDGQMLLTEWGPAEWGHPESAPGEYVATASVYLPGVSDLLRLQTRKVSEGGRVVDSFERVSLAEDRYRFRIEQDEMKVHPTGSRVAVRVNLDLDMNDGAPLLAGGRGTWLYGTPEYFGGYPSRSFQYSQAPQRLTGTISIEQPDGALVTEEIDPARSTMVLTHEYDATPEDIPGGLALATASQLHHRFVQEYQGGIPWELMYMDLGNGAQLQLLVQAYHDTEDGLIQNGFGAFSVPTYRVMGTVRLPSGESVALDDRLFVEHLEYREIVGRVPTTFVAITGQWTQTWRLRVGFPGGTAISGDGGAVEVPQFDLGIEPFAARDNHFVDTNGNGLNQRVALRVFGLWDTCPVDGSSWSELIINWTGETDRDPWFTGGDPPHVQAGCDEHNTVAARNGNGKSLSPAGRHPALPDPMTAPEGCWAGMGESTCSYVASHDGGIGGYAAEPGGWTVTIERAGRSPIIVTGFTGFTTYGCGIIKPGDVVTAEAKPGSYANPGNPSTCN